jgi:hypothetical protein
MIVKQQDKAESKKIAADRVALEKQLVAAHEAVAKARAEFIAADSGLHNAEVTESRISPPASAYSR